MLRTTVAELTARLPSFALAIDPSYGLYSERAQLGLLQVWPMRGHPGNRRFARRFRMQRLLAMEKVERLAKLSLGVSLLQYGCVNLRNLDGLIDISGFAFSDQWGNQPALDFAALASYYRGRGRPVVLLPQAFGPFACDKIRVAMGTVIDACALIYCRDVTSLGYLRELRPDAQHIFQAPDITLFSPGSEYDIGQRDNEDFVCVVPNYRMLDQGGSRWKDRYLDIKVEMIRAVQRKNLRVLILVHDASGMDARLADQIYQRVEPGNAEVVNDLSAPALKSLIGRSRFLIGSRYHSLVAAFAQGVPAIALGWSHKYEMLLQDFACLSLLVSPDQPVSKAMSLVEDLCNRGKNERLRSDIRVQLNSMKTVNQTMWQSVVDCLQHGLAKQ